MATDMATAGYPSRSEIGVVVVTHAARRHLLHCLPPLLASPLRPRVLVVNSSSDDGTVELACRMGAETLVIPRRQFNHGLTRELARRHLATPIVVMLTPDAYARDIDFLDRLTLPIRLGRAAVAYGRQVPRDGAGLLERFGRAFNYPAEHQLRSLADWPAHGNYTHFCSNACAAWSNAALDSIGGFRATLVSEETIAVAELLARGQRIAYVADAVVCALARLRGGGRAPAPFRHRLGAGAVPRAAAGSRARRGARPGVRTAAAARGAAPAADPVAEGAGRPPGTPARLSPGPHRSPAAPGAGAAAERPGLFLDVQAFGAGGGTGLIAMRIAILTNNRLPAREGIGRHVTEVALRLQARGHRVDVLARGSALAGWQDAAIEGLHVAAIRMCRCGRCTMPSTGCRCSAGWTPRADGAELSTCICRCSRRCAAASRWSSPSTRPCWPTMRPSPSRACTRTWSG